MLDRIGKYIESNRDFIANAAHELRSPLAAIRSSVDVALDRPRSTDEYARLLTDVAEECTRLTNLVNRLLVLAEGDAGRLAPRDHQAQLDKVVRESVNMFEAVAESKGVELKVATLPSARGARRRISLAAGRAQFARQCHQVHAAAGKSSWTWPRIGRQANKALKVSDSGVGISTEDLPRIFERFLSRRQSPQPRSKPWRQRAGSGHLPGHRFRPRRRHPSAKPPRPGQHVHRDITLA